MRKMSQVKAFAGFVAIVLQLTLTKGFHRDIYGTSGVLSNFEDKHSHSSSYIDTWNITAPIGYRINVTIVYFTGTPSQCESNPNIEVMDVLSTQTAVECNSNSPSIYSSRQRVLQVTFKSIHPDKKYFATFEAFRRKTINGCDGNWTFLDGSCYTLFKRSDNTITNVRQSCKDKGGSLTSVNTKQENDLLRALMKKQNTDKVFIGLKYDDKRFVHSDRTPVIFTAWTKPPSFGPCVYVLKNGSWSESPFTLEDNYYSCEKKVLSRNMSYKECSRAVLQSRARTNICASTQDKDHPANKVTLNDSSGWVPKTEDNQPWIEVSFESPFLITAVATRGIKDKDSWVHRFSLSFVLYDERYVNFTNSRHDIVYFEGNRDAHNVAYNKLPYPLIAKTVRLVPEKKDNIGLRLEFYGCPSDEAYGNCSQPLGLETSAVHDDFMTSSSHHLNSPPHNARLNIDLVSQHSCWSPDFHDTYPWLEIDFRSNMTRVTAIAIQGRGDDEVDEWVTKYALSYAEYQDNNFTYYKENNIRKIFQGNEDKASVVKTTLDPVIVVFALRIHPLAWYNHICMRLEIYGCQANSSYTAWSSWSNCTSWCNGLQNRTRNCMSSVPRNCPGPLVESRRCNIEACFSSWTEWSECNQTCGSGVRNRTKYYLGDRSSNKTCNGSLTVIEECNICDKWTTCNMTCGIGFKTRRVNCTDLSQSCKTQMNQCNQTNKPGIANFEIWSEWSECTSTCGGIFYQNRTRYPRPRSNVNSLVYNPEVESKECDCLRNESCNCKWSNWTICDATCGGGVQTRVFNCSYTTLGSVNLVNCSGSIHDTRICNNFSCPVDGKFTEWSSWNNCTATCGNGTRQRMRNCTNPPPAHGGNNCTGNTTEIEKCGTKPCPVDGNFTEWSNWTNCTATCGNGTRQRMRNCTNPPPAHGGNNCTGNTTEIEKCGTKPCPVDGNFTEWSNWTNCTATCGNGTRQRMRNCTNPSPSHGGNNCTGNTTEIDRCGTQLCPVDITFTEWSNWTNCTATCGNGTRQRMRNVTNSPPAHGGNNCTGDMTEIERCGTQPCPVDGNFTEWSNWTACSVSCGNGTRQRMRYCTNPPPAHGGNNCTGNTTEIQGCGTQSCPDIPINGNFTEWSQWTNCTQTCGTGTQERMRTCTSPPPANGGANCSDHTNETQNCNTHHCPIHGNWTSWSDWSYCNRPCGMGYENSTRSCTNPVPMYEGRKCEGPSNKSRACNNFTCPAAEVLVAVHFTKENWTNDLKDLDSDASRKLKDKILKNLKDIYRGHGINVTNIEITSFSKGSVMSNFTIFFSKMDNLQLVILQESMQVTGLLTTMPVRNTNFNTTNVPSLSPTILAIKNQTSTSIFMSWTHVPSIYLKGKNLSGYSIFYKEKQAEYLPNQLKPVTPDKNNTVVDGMKKYTDYSLRILAFTESGNGIASEPIDFRTEEDVPSEPPSEFSVTARSSTAISAEWKHIDPAFIHGILLGYNVTVTNLNSGEMKFQLYGPSHSYSLVENLKRYTDYLVKVCGYTSKGCGVTAEDRIKTLEDAPTKPPRNVRALNLSSTSELKVYWTSPELDGINGLLRGYTLQYKIKSTSGREVQEARVIEKEFSSSDLECTLTNLMSYTVYEIKIAARTNGGLGPFALIYGETCRCPKTFKTNYWFLTPYLNKTSSGKVQGIFSHIIRNMIIWACADCKNGHGKTVVDFKHDGSGSQAEKNSMLDVIANVHHGAQVSFPINGNKYIERVYGGQPFVPIIESPGVAFLAHQYTPISPAWNILNSVLGTLPFILFSLLLAYVAGVIVWFLDSDAPEGSSFPRSFIKGANEGMWWSFISMTTVGYGDRSPTRITSRLFAIIWTLYGMVLVSIITSAVTTSLTTVTVETTKKIYGLPIAAIENSSEHRLGLLMNGKVNLVRQYHSVEDIHEALVRREVLGALIDTYVVATDIKRFTDDDITVTRLLDRPFGYGIALSIGAASLEYPCRDYLKLHENEIIALIESSTGQLKKPDKSPSEATSSGLFDPDSILYRNSVLFVGCILLFAVLCGTVWHFIYKAKHSRKVTSWARIQREKQEQSRKMLKKIVEEFYIDIIRKIQMMKKRHRKERLILWKREKERETLAKEVKNVEEVEDDDDFNMLFKNALQLLKR